MATRTRSTRSTKATAPEAEVDKVDETAAAVEQTEVATPEGDNGQTPEGEATNDGEGKAEGEAPKAEAKAPKARAGKKLVWTNTTDKNANGECEGVGKRNGNVYQILQNEDGTFNAFHFVEDADGSPVGDRTQVAESVTGAVAWRKCVDHHNINYIAVVAEETPAETTEGEASEAGTEVATADGDKVEAAS